jgi:hypothetical protein
MCHGLPTGSPFLLYQTKELYYLDALYLYACIPPVMMQAWGFEKV